MIRGGRHRATSTVLSDIPVPVKLVFESRPLANATSKISGGVQSLYVDIEKFSRRSSVRPHIHAAFFLTRLITPEVPHCTHTTFDSFRHADSYKFAEAEVAGASSSCDSASYKVSQLSIGC